MTTVAVMNQNAQGTMVEKNVAIAKAGQTLSVSLDKVDIVKLGVHPDQVANISREGNHAVVQLKDGSQIVLENFFIQTNPQLVLQDGQSLWAAQVSQNATGGTVIDYAALSTLDDLVVAKSIDATLPTWGLVAGGVAGAVGIIGAVVGVTKSIKSDDKKDHKDIAPPESAKANQFSTDGKAITGKAEVGSTVTVKDAAGTVLATAKSNAQGEYNVKLPTALKNGEEVSIRVKDAAGNESVAVKIKAEDSTAPVKAELNQFSTDGKSITGKAEAGSTVSVKDATGKEIATATVGTDGKYSVTLPTALLNGEKVSITVKDAAGNESVVVSVTAPDITPPTAGTLSLSNFEDTGVSDTDRITKDNTFDLTLTGQEAGATVKYQVSKDAGKTWVDTTVNQKDLADGEYQFKAVVTDAAGNSKDSVVQQVTVDATAPVAGTLSLSNFEDTGVSDTDRITKDNTFDLTLTGQEAGTTVVYKVSKDVGKTWTDTTVNQKDLTDGEYQFKAVVTDAAGNSKDSVVQQVTVDATAPVAGTLSLSNFEDTGVSDTDRITKDNTFDLTLTGQEAGTTVVYKVSKDVGKTWTDTTVNQKDLTDGEYQFKAVVTDAAGNSKDSVVQQVTVDATAPVAGTLSLSNFEDTGVSDTDRITKDNTFDLTLTGQEAGTTVVYKVSKDVGKTWTDTTVNQKDLTDGEYQFKAVVTDAAGNSKDSVVQQVTVDATAPVAGTLSLSNFEDTGVSDTDRITKDNTFDLTLTGQEAGTTVVYKVSKDVGKTWTDTTVNQKDLTDGEYQFKAVVTDAAGNSKDSVVQQVTVDATAPVAGTLSLSNFEDTGVSDTDRITKDNTFDLTLTGQEAGTTVVYKVSKDVGKTWTDTTVNQKDLTDGEYQFKAVVTDVAGNSKDSAVQKVTVDATAPVIGALYFENFEYTQHEHTSWWYSPYSVSNTFDLSVWWKLIDDVAAYQMSKDGGVTWGETTATQENIADAKYQFQAIVTDVAGNSTSSNVQNIIVDNGISQIKGIFPLDIVAYQDQIEAKEKEDSDGIYTYTYERVIRTEQKSFTFSEMDFDGDKLVYQVSRDNGKTWADTSVFQNNLEDGVYIYRVGAGNSLKGLKIIVDSSSQDKQALTLGDFVDNGSDSSDQITDDNTFRLISGFEDYEEYYADVDYYEDAHGEPQGYHAYGKHVVQKVIYEVSTDGGTHWIKTDALQENLVGGEYLYRAVVRYKEENFSSADGEDTIEKTVYLQLEKPVMILTPEAGTLNLLNLEDTGISNADRITKDNTFDLTLIGQKSGTTVVYQISKDGGTIWADTTTNQKDLADGTYQFKAVVTDAAGNSIASDIQIVTVDNLAPVSTLDFANFEDTGVSDTDRITKDKTFDLTLTGQEEGATVVYQVSKDGGTTWANTTVNQNHFWDGEYQYKAIVTDIAGNITETVQTVIIDNVAPNIDNKIILLDYQDNDAFDTDYISQDNSFILSVDGISSDVIQYQIRKNGWTWEDTTARQDDLADGGYEYRAVILDPNFADTAGNQPIIYTDVTVYTNNSYYEPLYLQDYDDTGVSGSDYISSDRTFLLYFNSALDFYEISLGFDTYFETTVKYEISNDSGLTWQPTTDVQHDLADGAYRYRSTVFIEAFGGDKGGDYYASETYYFDLGQTIVVDTIVTTGILSLSNFEDTGVSDTDRITKDNTFDLTLTGQEVDTTVVYQVSKDGGTTWTDTTANQKDLTDGEYQFKAIVTDVAGNTDTTAVQKVIVDQFQGDALNNVLIGNSGNNTFTGFSGSDTVIFNLLNAADATGGNGHDTWTDFHVGDTATDSEADKIDISALLVNYAGDGSAASLAKYIHIVQDGENVVLHIDRDGERTAFNSVELLTLTQVNITLDDLLYNQQIMV